VKPGPILLVGPLPDPTFSHTIAALYRQRRRFDVLDLDRFWVDGVVEGRLDNPASLRVRTGGEIYRLGAFRSCYARLVDLRRAPALEPAGVQWGRFRVLSLALGALPAMVVNRPGAGDSNASKPLQTSLIQQHGFRVPRSCSTNLPEEAARFVRSCPRGAIYKSNSGVRSIVQAVGPEDEGRLDALRGCPVFFQERIWGADLRVHVVGERCHAVRINSPAVDYRYDTSGTATASAFDVPPSLSERCVSVTRAFGLELSGIDLVQSDDGEFYCLEVNPMPGYSGYDHTLDYAISDSLGTLLS
jgi:hypothetical protein